LSRSSRWEIVKAMICYILVWPPPDRQKRRKCLSRSDPATGLLHRCTNGNSALCGCRGLCARVRRSTYAHSPLRITGVTEPSWPMPSTSISAEPIIQSIWIKLELPPRALTSSAVMVSPSTKHLL